ncbi:MAG: exodeoxyribonuclease VII large subunit [Aeromonadaceae bacterium]|nr:exodeoxyribonuclease VII large subunit [Aeromonadaceae bacterium]
MSSTPVFTVSHLNSTVRILLEQEMGLVWLTGEISNLVMHSSGHWYFSLKDPGAQVRCAMFRGNNRRVAFRPQSGQQVLVQARLSLYEPRGEYQLVIESMQPGGDGLLQLQLEQLRQKLQAEGLFDLERKRPLPASPRTIGIITSPTGAAIHDLLTVLARRAPALKVILYPAQVQGEQAAEQLCRALMSANQRAECDLLIIGRGGGAREDLWCFNDERLVRCIAQSKLPVISAVGHESDVTLSDLVADLRAPTPSAAAELASPDQRQQMVSLKQLQHRLKTGWQRYEQHQRHRLGLTQQKLRHLHPERRLQQQQQRLDELCSRLQQKAQQALLQRQHGLDSLEHKLQRYSPSLKIDREHHRLKVCETALRQALRDQMKESQQSYHLLMARLDAMSPLKVLARGYSITSRDNGEILHATTQVSIGEKVITRLTDGELHLRVESKITHSDR